MNFYKAVEEYFLLRRGRLYGMSSYNLLSPKEIHLIKEWEELGIPIKVIKNGIDESLKRFLDNYPSRRDEPPGLMYCKPTVLKYWRRYKEVKVGDKDSVRDEMEVPSSAYAMLSPLVDALEIYLQNKLEKVDDSTRVRIEKAINETKATLEKMIDEYERKALTSAIINDIGNELINRRSIIIKEISSALSLGSVKSIMRKVHYEIGSHRHRMERSSYRETRRELFNDMILREFGLPELKID